jgi:hypothetical protein
MKLIYRCLHCGAQNEAETKVALWTDAFNIAYTPTMEIERDATGVKPYTTHPCAPYVIGVAQLIGVSDYV